MITVDDAMKALDYLKHTDISCAKARALHEGLSSQKKVILAIEFKKAQGGTKDREAAAAESEPYKKLLSDIDDAFLEYEILRNQRRSCELQIEMWRSINSNQRKGNI